MASAYDATKTDDIRSAVAGNPRQLRLVSMAGRPGTIRPSCSARIGLQEVLACSYACALYRSFAIPFALMVIFMVFCTPDQRKKGGLGTAIH
jgi:hypothetical protein